MSWIEVHCNKICSLFWQRATLLELLQSMLSQSPSIEMYPQTPVGKYCYDGTDVFVIKVLITCDRSKFEDPWQAQYRWTAGAYRWCSESHLSGYSQHHRYVHCHQATSTHQGCLDMYASSPAKSSQCFVFKKRVFVMVKFAAILWHHSCQSIIM